jgi:serine/threonine-protein kinase
LPAHRQASATHARTKPKQRSTHTATKPRTSTQGTQQRASSQAATDDPVALNNQGFALIGAGQPAVAVPLLQRSVQAFRRQQRQGEIDYAFALFNLGNALRLSGHPAEAIPYLEERLGVSDFKRGVVEQELATAREQAGLAPTPKQGKKKGNGNGRGHSKGRGAAVLDGVFD